MLFRLLVAVLLVPAGLLSAEDATSETSIRIYSLVDLVCGSAMPTGIPSEPDPQHALADHIASQLAAKSGVVLPLRAGQVDENAQAVAALKKLQSLVESFCGRQSAIIQSHEETLSLIVRHTTEGHQEIEDFLQQLRRNNQPSIQVTCQLIGGEDLDEVPEEQREQAASLLMFRKVLNPEEAEHVKKDLVPRQLSQQKPETLRLVAGRKTPSLLIPFAKVTMTAWTIPGEKSIQLRVTCQITSDDTELIPYTVQTFDIPEGSSAIYLCFNEDTQTVWLLTPSRIEATAPTP